MNTNLTFKITSTILVLLSLTLGMLSLLNYFKFDTTLADIVLSRSDVTALDLKNTIENSFKMGLTLSGNSNLQELINRTKQQNEQVLQIEIFRQNGLILFSTEPDRIQKSVDSSWLKYIDMSSNKAYRVFGQHDSEAFNVFVNLFNSYGKLEGVISLQSSKEYHSNKVNMMFFSLSTNLILVLLCSSILTTILVFLVFRNTSNSFKKMNQALLPLLTHTEDETATELLIKQPSNDLEQHCQQFQQQAQQAFQVLAQAQRAIATNQTTDLKE